MTDFQKPDFLIGKDAAAIQQRMMARLPPDLDDSEGGFPWDFTMPSALEAAELLQFYLVETIKLMFPMWASDKWLDYHAQLAGVKRRAANPAAGKVEVTGIPGTVIPSGFRFAAPSVKDSPALEYFSLEEGCIGDLGTAELRVQAVEPGVQGNIVADSIAIMSKPMKGIIKITNPEKMTGGTEIETDDALRDRIMDVYESEGASFVGNDSDYIRWAKEAPGVGAVTVVPEWKGPGTVKVVVLDANGQPANKEILGAVTNYIVSPSDRLARKAPIGALVTIAAPTAKEISYAFVLQLHPGCEETDVINAFKKGVQKYYVEAKKEGVVKYYRIAAILTACDGVYDFTELTVGGEEQNISIAGEEYPVTGAINGDRG